MRVASAEVTGTAACSADAISAMHWASPQGNRSLAGLMSIDTDFVSVAGDRLAAQALVICYAVGSLLASKACSSLSLAYCANWDSMLQGPGMRHVAMFH